MAFGATGIVAAPRLICWQCDSEMTAVEPVPPAAATRLAKLAEAQINSLAMKVRFELAVQSAEDLHQSKGSAVKGTGFSPYVDSSKTGGALAPEGNADVKGTGFSPYA